MEQMRAAILQTLGKTDKGGTDNTIQNCMIVFENDPVFAGKISRNLLTETDDIIGEMPWKRTTTRYDDQDRPHVLLHFEQYYGIRSEKSIENAFRVVASKHSFHPICDYLRSLTWDGIPRVRVALHHFLGVDINDFHETCLRVFMLGAVKRVFQPGCKFDLMPALTGGQGAGKSSFLRLLAIKDEWFSDDIRKLDDEKIYQKLAGHWIMEMSEMVATANTKSIEEIKSFLTRTKDNYKFPYGRYASDHLRQCVFAGTTNRLDLLPCDRSGNRRFLPIQVHTELAEVHILDDEAASRAYIDQMWAEIMVIYDSGGYSTHLDKDMEKQLAHEQEAFMQEDTTAGQIFDFIDHFQGDRICSRQLYVEALGNECGKPKQWETREICEIVNRGIETGDIQGWRAFTTSRRFDKYGTQRGWERIPASVPSDSVSAVNRPSGSLVDKYEQMGFTVIENDTDCPF